MASDTENLILQAGALPFRRTGISLEILLITSSSSRKWILPKGNREPTMTLPECAAMEAFEEAGIMGPISQQAIGTWRYAKHGVTRQVEFFPLEATRVLSLWPEKGFRRRRWMPIPEAADRVSYPEMAEFIHGLPEFLEVHIFGEAEVSHSKAR